MSSQYCQALLCLHSVWVASITSVNLSEPVPSSVKWVPGCWGVLNDGMNGDCSARGLVQEGLNKQKFATRFIWCLHFGGMFLFSFLPFVIMCATFTL